MVFTSNQKFKYSEFFNFTSKKKDFVLLVSRLNLQQTRIKSNIL